MKKGKHICETLKGIRSEIAIANEIDYSPTECHHEGDCAGTCPKCESETRWLEKQLRVRQALGKAVTIAGLSLAIGTLTSCHNHKASKSDSVDSMEELEESKESHDSATTAGIVDESFFNSVSKGSDSTKQITPLKSDGNKACSKDDDDDDDEKYQLMGEVAVDENGNTYGP